MEENLALLAKVQELELQKYRAEVELRKTVDYADKLFKDLTEMDFRGKILLPEKEK